ncbi:nitrite reductase [NAD(P)H], large subunit [marine gamma proteobacterium HTCC2207]|jgi:nitrite reductase (NADH) large subunit|uniref:Nitrite reductase [NAD(P)H], large subunit n=1 Tax=gamma proteobacterium HTCC2207 TaxID=314287 RepID=Q1YUV5_9GAMM|nr:nitrite reductase [NAD(P)H], large subunit [marine gamma proteobacterium HTCC2207] [gamma proteobacterium HTCC2207]MBT5105093.1 nitrite reductase large subunit [Porticoccaceae bacterium]MBT6114969.1 nitrite reductase large subunit [Porticoccaceae bacterium]MBT6594332.1 nitrite reductase large subunit [Porticoccaceae bacterium]MDG1080460.1 nitrite reductase large subunit NirB [Porticoccaceae bacterium]
MLKVVVVGNGMVGHHYVEQLVASDVEAQITVIGGETRPAYDRVHLSEFFAGRSPEDLALTTRDHYRELGVEAHFGDMVASIDRDTKTLTTESGKQFAYDKLVLATGSYPFVPPVKGNDLEPCTVYRTIDDLGTIQAQATGGKIGVVVGGGLLGLECANAVKNLGLETHVVEFAPGLMGVQLDGGGSAMLRRKIEALGVTVHTSKATKVIEPDAEGEARLRMQFADGSSLATDMIVFSAGIRPYDQLAKDCGLTVGERGGIEIDYHCKTSDSDIFAIGECALFGGRIYGLVAPGYRMAEAAVSQLTNEVVPFQGADMSTKLKLLGVDVGSIGDAHGKEAGSVAYTFSDERIDVYKRLIVSADGKKLLGAVLVGDCSDYDTLLQYFLNGIALPADPQTLILPYNAGAAPALGAAALPATATICSCHNVSKGDIVNAMDAGFCSLAEVKSETAASSGCGGCAALLKSVVDDELASRGLEVNKAMCEHFNLTRQEMFHIVKVESIKSFEELISKHGSGRGCDICKPTAGSILASLWNDYVLEEKHVGLQDTNDTFLANMQKNGTYSVVPRIAGGEITPDKLITIGQVAKKYNLYTKITGGQRIDLFGARVQHLPGIWEELIAAGFETGHAYGKALRTVKSCVGSTWCRYGVQDSVAMALYIENRYKGLRSPHKLKSAVSGCTRECAEAQSKDFGVIATENGWNLFVGGNGGMKPRHADLFATDLDDETLIKYIDRFLMFYVRTADRLQRTSVWMGTLEGGLDYLKQVVIEDSLGIAGELEEQMESIVGSYQCEWKTTVEDPEKLKRFRQFVNSKAEDREIIFVEERGQPRPATDAERKQLLAESA